MTLDNNDNIEKYACDFCKSSKVTCSRQRPECERCRKTGAKCTYSRSGVIRRCRKRKYENTNDPEPSPTVSIKRTVIAGRSTTRVEGAQSHLTADIEETRDRLRGLSIPENHSSLAALSSLSEACATSRIGRDATEHGPIDRNFIPFEEYAAEWAEVFERFLSKGGPSMRAVPLEVLDHLRAARPQLIQERAWLVIYYTIILDTVTSKSLKEGLRRNLRLALSDVDVLLEPTELNIHALVFVLSQASEFTGPALSWMLATNACRMIQALGINQRSLDTQTRERRLTTFWHLNLLDKGLAIIFGRTPTFHRQMVTEIGLPKLEQIQPFKRHHTSNDSPGFFGAHYMYQKILLSHLMDEIWDCLYGEAKTEQIRIERANDSLKSWHEEAKRILEAAALSEKPFCDAENASSIDVALHTIDFHFLHLTILLMRSSSQSQENCFDASKRMLHLLQHMAPASREPYHPMIWQLVCCPFTPMLILFRSILSCQKRDSEGNEEALAAMEQLPNYLKEMGPRNSLASALEKIAKIFVLHARSIVHGPGSTQPGINSPTGLTSPPSPEAAPDSNVPLDLNTAHLDSPLDNNSLKTPKAPQLGTGEFDTELDHDLRMFTNNYDDGLFDWLSWESQTQ